MNIIYIHTHDSGRFIQPYGYSIQTPNIDASPTKEFLLTHRLKDHGHDPPEMLFDLYFDPNERENLVERIDSAKIKADMEFRLE